MTIKPEIADIKESFIKELQLRYNISPDEASDKQIYQVLSSIIVEFLKKKRQKFINKVHSDGKKQVYYLSMEFLMGRSLKTSLYNLEIAGEVEKMLKEYGVKLENVYEYEPDAGLGNGGLGRLAACYLDALALRHIRRWAILSAMNTEYSSRSLKTAGRPNFLITGCPAAPYGLIPAPSFQ